MKKRIEAPEECKVIRVFLKKKAIKVLILDETKELSFCVNHDSFEDKTLADLEELALKMTNIWRRYGFDGMILDLSEYPLHSEFCSGIARVLAMPPAPVNYWGRS